jgi:hypothetical protein
MGASAPREVDADDFPPFLRPHQCFAEMAGTDGYQNGRGSHPVLLRIGTIPSGPIARIDAVELAQKRWPDQVVRAQFDPVGV